MKKIVVLMLSVFISSSLFAYSDSDLDGVADSVDRCPNTPFMDLVDINGCTKESLKTLVSPHHFDVILGASYSDSDYQSLNKTDTISSSLQADYYYKKFSIQASTSYFSTDGSGYSDSGMNDSYLGASYQFEPTQALTLRVGAGVILPTYDAALNNNNTDYSGSLNLSYKLSSVNLFGAYTYTIINDDNVDNSTAYVKYQDTNAYSVGLGFYPTQKLYVSGAYNASDSVYVGTKDIETASAYIYYSIDTHWFTTLSYAYGLSDSASDNYAAVRVGYYF